jgi:hypothetical protein
MKLASCLVVCAAISLGAATINFDDSKPGSAPSGWNLTKTGKGEPRWTIEQDSTGASKPNVLKQSGEATYPLAIKEDSNVKDGFVEVKFKAVSGEEDQAGGIIWRCKDPDNYYICRANALENNVRIYHFVKGKRTQFKGANLPVPAKQWHTLRVDFSGKQFKVTFNAKELFTAEDETIADAGKVGLWTKADSITLFDDFSYGAK